MNHCGPYNIWDDGCGVPSLLFPTRLTRRAEARGARQAWRVQVDEVEDGYIVKRPEKDGTEFKTADPAAGGYSCRATLHKE